MSWHKACRAADPSRKFLPGVETLEIRCVPAVSVSQSGGLLLIRGDNHRNVIEITDNGGTAAGSVQVTSNGQTFSSTGAVSEIQVRTGRGRDSVTFNLTGDLSAKAQRTLDVQLGGGNDTFTANLNGSLQSSSNLDTNVDGGPGNDTIRINAAGNVNVASGATLRLFLVGGDDNDQIDVNYQGQVNGSLLYRAEGNPGMDRINGDFLLLNGSTGRVQTEERGGTNLDHLNLFLRQQNPADAVRVSGLIDGGPFLDFATHTSNVTSQRVEVDRTVS